MKTCTTCGTEWPDDTKFCPSDGSPLKVAESADLIGGILDDKYHIIAKLGEGGMGAVYLGEHVRMGRKSAIKVLTQSLAQDHDSIARFNREASSAAQINHPNVCAIYDFGDTKDGLIYLAMEFIEGESLTELSKREGPLGPYRAAEIIRQAGAALQAAHHLGIVHRDLKPDNIMVTTGRDGSEVVKVVDFGIAKAMGGEEGQKVTRTGLVVGTPEWMSPEQLSGDKLDGRSDTYSLALVMFHTLTGRLPFEADNAQEIMMKRLTDEPLRLNEALPGGNFPLKLQHVIDRALQRMPDDRYASVEEFTRDATQAVSGEYAKPTVDSDRVTQLMDTAPTDQQATEQIPKTRISAAKPTLPLEQAAAAETVTPDTPLPLTQASPGEDKRGKRKPVVVFAASLVVVAAGVGAVAVAMSGGEEQPAGSRDSTFPAANTPITAIDTGGGDRGGLQAEDSAETQRPAMGGDETTGGSGDPSQSSDDPGQADPVATVIDTAAINAELTAMIDEMENVDQRPRLIARAEGIYQDVTMPDDLRGFAAAQVGFGYRLNRDFQTACDWINRAIEMRPDNSLYKSTRTTWECTP